MMKIQKIKQLYKHTTQLHSVEINQSMKNLYQIQFYMLQLGKNIKHLPTRHVHHLQTLVQYRNYFVLRDLEPDQWTSVIV